MNIYRRKMRNAALLCFIATALIALAWIGTGCNGAGADGPVDGNKLLSTTDRLYTSIKIVVTDPEVRPLFSDEDMARLAELEQTYLAATETLRANPDDAGAIEVIAGVATDILMIVNGTEFTDKYRPAVAAIRISINILKSHLGT